MDIINKIKRTVVFFCEHLPTIQKLTGVIRSEDLLYVICYRTSNFVDRVTFCDDIRTRQILGSFIVWLIGRTNCADDNCPLNSIPRHRPVASNSAICTSPCGTR